MTARGIRNNNPGNIKKTTIEWEGQIDSEDEQTFAVFSAPWWGLRAIAKILTTYYRKHHLDTPNKIISRWAPSSDDNPEQAYALFIANRLGVNPDDQLEVDDYKIMKQLMQAIVQFENGTDPYSWEYDAGLILAGIEPDDI